MAKGRTTAQPVRTELTTDKEKFKKVLAEQLEIGQQLFLRQIATETELASMKGDYNDWIVYISEFLKHSFNKPNNEYREGFNMEGYTFLGRIGTYRNEVDDYKDLINLRMAYLRNMIKTADMLPTSFEVTHQTDNMKKNGTVSKDEVFIVHGHDEEAKIKTARFIEKLGFKPIILHEQASSGNTIIEKIEEHSNVGFGIVLYTPCDVGGKKMPEPVLNNRARQNVVFEHGYLIGKIGRRNVCALVKGDVEKPNDISGVVYISMDNDGAWQLAVAKELRSSDYAVDMNKVV